MGTLLLDGADEVDVNTVSDRILKRALKHLRTPTTTKKLDYMDRAYFNPTSSCCERLFVKFGHAFSNRRRGISSMIFESQIFMYVNDKNWGVDDMKVIVSNRTDAKSDKDWWDCSAKHEVRWTRLYCTVCSMQCAVHCVGYAHVHDFVLKNGCTLIRGTLTVRSRWTLLDGYKLFLESLNYFFRLILDVIFIIPNLANIYSFLTSSK